MGVLSYSLDGLDGIQDHSKTVYQYFDQDIDETFTGSTPINRDSSRECDEDLPMPISLLAPCPSYSKTTVSTSLRESIELEMTLEAGINRSDDSDLAMAADITRSKTPRPLRQRFMVGRSACSRCRTLLMVCEETKSGCRGCDRAGWICDRRSAQIQSHGTKAGSLDRIRKRWQDVLIARKSRMSIPVTVSDLMSAGSLKSKSSSSGSWDCSSSTPTIDSYLSDLSHQSTNMLVDSTPRHFIHSGYSGETSISPALDCEFNHVVETKNFTPSHVYDYLFSDDDPLLFGMNDSDEEQTYSKSCQDLRSRSLIDFSEICQLEKFSKKTEKDQQPNFTSSMPDRREETGESGCAAIDSNNKNYTKDPIDVPTFHDNGTGKASPYSSQDMDGESDSLNESDIDLNDMDYSTSPSPSPSSKPLNLVETKIIRRVLACFWNLYNSQQESLIVQCTQGLTAQEGDSGTSNQVNESDGVAPVTQNLMPPPNISNVRKRKLDEDDPPDDDEDQQPRKPDENSFSPQKAKLTRKYACPFRKHNPRKYNIHDHEGCVLGVFPSIARLKEHLYRRHKAPIQCIRCWLFFKSQELLDIHLGAESICKNRPGERVDGLTLDVEARLRRRTRLIPGQQDEDRWREIYRLIFPGEEVPSPFYDPIEDSNLYISEPQTVSIEEFLRQEVPESFTRLLQKEVSDLKVVDGDGHIAECVTESFIARMGELVTRAQDAAIEAYRRRGVESMSQTNQLMTPAASSMMDSYPTRLHEASARELQSNYDETVTGASLPGSTDSEPQTQCPVKVWTPENDLALRNEVEPVDELDWERQIVNECSLDGIGSDNIQALGQPLEEGQSLQNSFMDITGVYDDGSFGSSWDAIMNWSSAELDPGSDLCRSS